MISSKKIANLNPKLDGVFLEIRLLFLVCTNTVTFQLSFISALRHRGENSTQAGNTEVTKLIIISK